MWDWSCQQDTLNNEFGRASFMKTTSGFPKRHRSGPQRIAVFEYIRQVHDEQVAHHGYAWARRDRKRKEALFGSEPTLPLLPPPSSSVQTACYWSLPGLSEDPSARMREESKGDGCKAEEHTISRIRPLAGLLLIT